MGAHHRRRGRDRAPRCPDRHSRAARHPSLAQLGADQAVDDTRQEFDDVVRDFDFVLDLAGGQTPLRAMPTLRDGGLLTAVTLRWDLASEGVRDAPCVLTLTGIRP